VRAFDRRVKIDFALRNMAVGALGVAHLRAARMVDTGREINVVVQAPQATRVGLVR